MEKITAHNCNYNLECGVHRHMTDGEIEPHVELEFEDYYDDYYDDGDSHINRHHDVDFLTQSLISLMTGSFENFDK